jgi:hypothetical protein
MASSGASWSSWRPECPCRVPTWGATEAVWRRTARSGRQSCRHRASRVWTARTRRREPLLGTGPGCSAASSIWLWRPVFRHCVGGGSLAPFRCAAVAHCASLRPSPRSRSSPVSCVIASWRPSHLPLPLPVVAKHASRSTKPTPAWAQRRGARRSGVFRPFALCKAVGNRPPQLFRRAAPRPSKSLRRSRHPSYAACPGRALPRCAAPHAAAACCGGVLGEPPALRASGGRGGAKKWLVE